MTFPNIIGPDKFAGGVLTYNDRFGNDPNTRIVIPVVFENLLATTAVLDTGAPWCVLNPYDAEVLNLENRADCWESLRPLSLRGFKYQGRLCRIPVSFEADRGMGM